MQNGWIIFGDKKPDISQEVRNNNIFKIQFMMKIIFHIFLFQLDQLEKNTIFCILFFLYPVSL